MVRTVKRIFSPDFERYEGVRPINVYAMRVFYVLMATLLARESWGHILSHSGAWDPKDAMAWTVWAAFASLAVLGVFHPLKMIPILLLEIFYKGLWLILVALPLWRAGLLKGSTAEGMTQVFAPVILVALSVPWGYVLRTYVRGARRPTGAGPTRGG